MSSAKDAGGTCFWAALSKMRASHLPLRSCQRTPLYMEEPLRRACQAENTHACAAEALSLAQVTSLSGAFAHIAAPQGLVRTWG